MTNSAARESGRIGALCSAVAEIQRHMKHAAGALMVFEYLETTEWSDNKFNNGGALSAENFALRDELLSKVVSCSPEDLDCSLVVELEYSDSEIERYKQTIRDNDAFLPIVVGNNGSIVAGRGRVEAAIWLGIYTIPALRLSSMTFDDVDHYIETLFGFGEAVGWTDEMLDTDLRNLLKISVMAKAATMFSC